MEIRKKMRKILTVTGTERTEEWCMPILYVGGVARPPGKKLMFDDGSELWVPETSELYKARPGDQVLSTKIKFCGITVWTTYELST